MISPLQAKWPQPGLFQLVCTDIEMEMRKRMPELTQVFLDPSEVTTNDLHRTRKRERQTLDDVD
jgi:hypothetical protein